MDNLFHLAVLHRFLAPQILTVMCTRVQSLCGTWGPMTGPRLCLFPIACCSVSRLARVGWRRRPLWSWMNPTWLLLVFHTHLLELGKVTAVWYHCPEWREHMYFKIMCMRIMTLNQRLELFSSCPTVGNSPSTTGTEGLLGGRGKPAWFEGPMQNFSCI